MKASRTLITKSPKNLGRDRTLQQDIPALSLQNSPTLSPQPPRESVSSLRQELGTINADIARLQAAEDYRVSRLSSFRGSPYDRARAASSAAPGRAAFSHERVPFNEAHAAGLSTNVEDFSLQAPLSKVKRVRKKRPEPVSSSEEERKEPLPAAPCEAHVTPPTTPKIKNDSEESILGGLFSRSRSRTPSPASRDLTADANRLQNRCANMHAPDALASAKVHSSASVLGLSPDVRDRAIASGTAGYQMGRRAYLATHTDAAGEAPTTPHINLESGCFALPGKVTVQDGYAKRYPALNTSPSAAVNCPPWYRTDRYSPYVPLPTRLQPSSLVYTDASVRELRQQSEAVGYSRAVENHRRSLALGYAAVGLAGIAGVAVGITGRAFLRTANTTTHTTNNYAAAPSASASGSPAEVLVKSVITSFFNPKK